METRNYTNEDDKNIIGRMDTLIGEWDQLADRRVDFLRCYRFMTNNMLIAIRQDEFNDGPWVRMLLVHFADYYFSALSSYDKQPSHTPIVWSTVHNTSNQEGSLVLQNLLLGINTHINYDLVLILYDIL